MKVAHTSTTSTEHAQVTPSSNASGTTPLAPRPAPPRQQLTARMAPQLRDLDWDPRSHIEHAADWPTVPAYSDAWGRPSAWAALGSAA